VLKLGEGAIEGLGEADRAKMWAGFGETGGRGSETEPNRGPREAGMGGGRDKIESKA
jgi:hypothetical protein